MGLPNALDPVKVAAFFRPQVDIESSWLPAQCLRKLLAEVSEAGVQAAAIRQRKARPAGRMARRFLCLRMPDIQHDGLGPLYSSSTRSGGSGLDDCASDCFGR